MIIPTAEFDPMFADDGIPFGRKMQHYILQEFADELGQFRGLADTDEGLAALSAALFPQSEKIASQRDAA